MTKQKKEFKKRGNLDQRKEKVDKILKIVSAYILFFIGSMLLFAHILNYLNLSRYQHSSAVFSGKVIENENKHQCQKIIKPGIILENKANVLLNNCNFTKNLGMEDEVEVRVLNKDLKNLETNRQTLVNGKTSNEVENNKFFNSDLVLPIFLMSVGAFWSYWQLYHKNLNK